MNEIKYQGKLIKRIEKLFPGCMVLRNDPKHRQGIPDLVVLFPGGTWAALEVKVSADALERPNQGHYVRLMNEMSFAAFVYPENEEEVINGLQRAFDAGRATRLSWGEQLPLGKLY